MDTKLLIRVISVFAITFVVVMASALFFVRLRGEQVTTETIKACAEECGDDNIIITIENSAVLDYIHCTCNDTSLMSGKITWN